MKNNIGERIKGLRKSKGINQTELAKIVNLSTTVMSMIEANRSNPSIETLNTMSEYFNVSIDYLLKGEEQKNAMNQEEEEILMLVRNDLDIKKTLVQLLDNKKKAIQRIMAAQNHELMAA